MTPLISVVVPTYNDPHRLRLCLEGLACFNNLPPGSLEVHVVNDGGVPIDELVAGYRDRLDVRCHAIRRGDAAGTGSARNLGLQHARFPRVLFLDQDCVVTPGLLEAHAAFAAYRDVVVGVRRHIDQVIVEAMGPAAVLEMDAFPFTPDSRLNDRWFARQRGDKSAMNPAAVYGCHMSVPTKEALAIGGHWEAFRGWGHQDVEFACRLGRVGCRLAVRSDLVVYHLDHPGQATTPEIEAANDRLRDETKRNRRIIVRNGGPLERLA